MASDVLMPRLSDSMEEGTVLKWLVEVGGEVKRGEGLVEIETDKANMTYEADTDGVLTEVLAAEGDTLAIGEPIARIGEAGEAPEPTGGEQQAGPDAEAEPDAEAQPEAERDAEAQPEAERDAEAQPEAERIKASPIARRIAGERGVDLAPLEGSGPGGRIVKADVEAAAKDGGAAADADAEAAAKDGGTAAKDGEAAPAPAEDDARASRAPTEEPKAASAAPTGGGESGAKGEVETQELSRLQRTVSRRMAESKATVPDFSLELDADMTLCIELRERLKEQAGALAQVGERERSPVPSYNDMIVKAAALALREHPRVNGAYRDGRFELYSAVNVGVAVAARDALVVPVIRDADEKSLGEIARRGRHAIERVREGTITPPELSGGTFTVSNLGMYGIERFNAIINPPQAAILSVGALMQKAAVDERGRVVAGDRMTLTLVCDHRILYGADGAEFLARVRALLQSPLTLAL
jgi:pyruvate dehydrogenase E2 component (dihydrolipoamide acetyltransferase)